MSVDQTDIYITGVLYQQDAYPTDPQPLFILIDNAFREISGLGYEYLDINRAENRLSNGTTREQLLIFMKEVKYNDESYLTDTSSSSVRTALINKLAELTDITYSDIEIRTKRTI